MELVNAAVTNPCLVFFDELLELIWSLAAFLDGSSSKRRCDRVHSDPSLWIATLSQRGNGHATAFNALPETNPGQELVVMMPSLLGPLGVTDWVDAVGKLCGTSGPISCLNAQRTRVRVLNYSARHLFRPRTSGRFEVGLEDGTIIEGTFSAKEHAPGLLSQAICE
jgi:hypothetical protein